MSLTQKEANRLQELAGISKKEGSTSIKSVSLIKESEDDLFGDIGDVFSQQVAALQGKISNANTLDKDLKTAMVLNNVSEAEAVEMDLYTKYNPKTKGAKSDTDNGTLYTKAPVQKLSGAISGFRNLEKKDRTPLTWGDDPEAKTTGVPDKHSLAKWHPLPKDENIISYEPHVDKFGFKTFTLSDRGKQQIEFLERMISDRPLPLSNDGNEDINIESALVGGKYKTLVITNAEKIIRDFFNKAVVPIVATALKRNKSVPKDAQFQRFVENGVDHAIDQTKNKKYNSASFSNYGAWFMQVVKNKVIDQLKSETSFNLDTTHIYDMLMNMPGPLKIDSQLNPKEAYGNYNSVVENPKFTFTKNGKEYNYFTYVYNNPEDALADLESKATKSGESETGFQKSPLKAQYLREPGVFYKSFMKEKPAFTSQETESPEYFENYEDVPANVLTRIASKEVDAILEQISKEIVVSSAKVGESVKLSGRENAKYPTLQKGKSYQVEEKGADPVPGGGTPKKFYIVTDETGEKIKVGARALTPIEAVEGNVMSKARENEQSVVEIMRLLLNYGRMKPAYTKTVYIPKFNEGQGGYSVKNVGDTAVSDRTGKLIIPYASAKDGARYKDLETAPIEYVWTSEKYSDEVNDKIISDLTRVANEKGINLPNQYFGPDNEPLYLKTNDENLKGKTIEFINGVRNALRRFFGFSTIENPIIKKNRDVLKRLLDNWQNSKGELSNTHTGAEQKSTPRNPLAENEIMLRKAVRKMIAEKMSKL